ncbi:helix-turn-helix transcriptional regulator [Lacticaseibacillus rhamnosus]|uniref:helix-turn-helix transcriptional regulator n=1 Tax=Lacticaseibacillus rhamnosus TaxID=47715 RepID=UPI0007E0F18B|nr:helix-turn-helix transcriptional regulator [Lacticaseibacillus rhamnosus]OAU79728.1 DNA-binding protein [Lacticaseibacillus rhamnosus]
MNKLLEARKAKRESQAQAANAIGIAQSMLAMMETGDRNGSDKTKRRVAEHYGKSVGELFLAILSHQEINTFPPSERRQSNERERS